MELVLLLVLVFLIWMIVGSGSEKEETEKPQTAAEKIGKDFANEAVQFFNGYLSLCKKHTVMGSCRLLYARKSEFGHEGRVECVITEINHLEAECEFRRIEGVWSALWREKMDAGDYEAATHAGDGYIEEYFGCKNLHYAFTEADEYQYKDGQVVIGYDRTLFTRWGATWDATLAAIKKELQMQWPTVSFDFFDGGIIVKNY